MWPPCYNEDIVINKNYVMIKNYTERRGGEEERRKKKEKKNNKKIRIIIRRDYYRVLR